MVVNVSRVRKPRSLRGPAVNTLVRFLAERGLSEEQIDRGLEYVEASGAYTIREAFILAMSRSIYSDEELAGGQRFGFTDNSAAAD